MKVFRSRPKILMILAMLGASASPAYVAAKVDCKEFTRELLGSTVEDFQASAHTVENDTHISVTLERSTNCKRGFLGLNPGYNYNFISGSYQKSSAQVGYVFIFMLVEKSGGEVFKTAYLPRGQGVYAKSIVFQTHVERYEGALYQMILDQQEMEELVAHARRSDPKAAIPVLATDGDRYKLGSLGMPNEIIAVSELMKSMVEHKSAAGGGGG